MSSQRLSLNNLNKKDGELYLLQAVRCTWWYRGGVLPGVLQAVHLLEQGGSGALSYLSALGCTLGRIEGGGWCL